MATQTQILTFFTNPSEGTQLLYAPLSTEWITVTCHLETAGPVAVGTAQSLAPVSSGKGRLLPSGADAVFQLSPGSRLYIISDTMNRVGVQIEPSPWLEQMFRLMQHSATPGMTKKPPPDADKTVPIGHFGFTMPGAPKKGR